MALPPDGPGSLAFWKGELSRSKDWWGRLAASRGWEKNLASYVGKPLESAPKDDTVIVPEDYANVEQKKAMLRTYVPEVALTAEQPGMEAAAGVFQAVLNRKLRPDDVNADAMLDEVLFDVLCPAGIGITKIGYEVDVQGELLVEKPVMDPSGQPITDPLTGQPAMTQEPAPNIVREAYFWNRVPLKRFRMPPDFSGIDFDRAPWLGVEFELDAAVAARTYQIPEEELVGKKSDEDGVLKADLPMEPSKAKRVTGYEVWYRAALYHPDIANQDVVYQLVWLDGMEQELVCRPSPYQRLDPNGKLIGGMKGYPLHVLTLRYVSDQAVPPSDVSHSRPLVDELSEGRSSMVRQRKRSTPLTAYDPGRVPKESIDRIVSGETQEAIPVPGLNANESPIQEVRKASFPRENFSFNDYVARDIEKTWAMGANQSGLQSNRKQTATEASIQQSATQTRMKREHDRVSLWFVRGVEKLGALIQLFADDQDYVEILGQNGVAALQAWDRQTIQGRFAFRAKPDSTYHIDAGFDKKAAMERYQFFRQDPLVNPTYLLQATAKTLGLDPGQFVAQPQPPQPQPITPSLTFKGEDLNPLMPQYANVYAVMTQAGVQGLTAPILSPEQATAVQAMAGQVKTDHGGMQPEVSPLSKHSADETGKLPGDGMAGSVQ